MDTITAVRNRILTLCGERSISINKLATIFERVGLTLPFVATKYGSWKRLSLCAILYSRLDGTMKEHVMVRK